VKPFGIDRERSTPLTKVSATLITASKVEVKCEFSYETASKASVESGTPAPAPAVSAAPVLTLLDWRVVIQRPRAKTVLGLSFELWGGGSFTAALAPFADNLTCLRSSATCCIGGSCRIGVAHGDEPAIG
jgi:hypothetical protein